MKDPVIQQCRYKATEEGDEGVVSGEMTAKQGLQVGRSVQNPNQSPKVVNILVKADVFTEEIYMGIYGKGTNFNSQYGLFSVGIFV